VALNFDKFMIMVNKYNYIGSNENVDQLIWSYRSLSPHLHPTYEKEVVHISRIEAAKLNCYIK
jgi:hypothetical protein